MERAKTSGRVDDNPESIVKRLETFNKFSVPVVEMLERITPGLVAKINVMQSIDEVFSDIEVVLSLDEPSTPSSGGSNTQKISSKTDLH